MTDTTSKEKRTLFIVYILAVYILFQLSWWGYHLIEINWEMLDLKETLTGESQDALKMKKVWMVCGEGSVFVIMLGLGFWYIKRTITRELQLARMEKTFLLSVTHELKTPIAAIKLFLETMKSRELTSAQSGQVIRDALRETKRLQSLSENILLATRLDKKAGVLMDENVLLKEIFEEEINRFELPGTVRFVKEISEVPVMKGDVQLLRAMLVNLIENAIKYSPLDNMVSVLLSRHEGKILIEIGDHGGGIPDDEKLKVFRKFYRLGNEETRSTQGTGLGLYITYNIVRLHKGEISIRNNVPTGSIFVITFPMKDI